MKTKSDFAVLAGSTLLTEKPFVHVLKSKLQGERCDHCFERTKLSQCSGCKYVYYCGRECQKASWPIHKKECPNLRRVAPRVVPDAARLLARIIFKLQNGGDKERSFYSKTGFRMFKDLMSHYSDIKKDSKRMEHFTSLCAVLMEYIGESSLPNSAELLGIYGRMVVNGFNILDPEMVSIGTGLYIGVSIIDHSCDPTSVAVFTGTTIHIRALQSMPQMDWSKVFITYVDLLNSARERQEDLQATYYFLCQCTRCLDRNELELQKSMLCPNNKCGASVPIFQTETYGKLCSKCNEHIKPARINEYLDIIDFTQHHLQSMKDVDIAYLDVCKVCLKKQDGLVHPMNLQRIKALDTAFESAIDVGSWEDAKKLGEEVEPGYRQYYGITHPLLGILYLKLGKLNLYLQCVEAALDWLLKAQDILRITHGERHPLYRNDVMPLIAQARQELRQ
ncbi:histone-lysine N-methyltransferase SMYD3 isoform X2 [Frankliniella occidentalis]|uniref:Histone-lysine N-methyltransferase SMYD3 isoform X2 n=1 Tax=Frankliniella occidentalis TaxID=133901 RepID=A0A6J1S5Z2_FRAOC|nr:histone-lysine N-methyltransferase SMYD3 isoform X2 [Frankliniella occidentalis]